MNLVGMQTMAHAAANLEPHGPFYAPSANVKEMGESNGKWEIGEAPAPMPMPTPESPTVSGAQYSCLSSKNSMKMSLRLPKSIWALAWHCVSENTLCNNGCHGSRRSQPHHRLLLREIQR